MTARKLDEAAACAQALLDPTQQKLPDALAAVLENAIIAHQQTQTTAIISLLTQAVTLAQAMNFL